MNQDDKINERLESSEDEFLNAYEKEREAILELEFEQELEQASKPFIQEAPERKKLKRELQREALLRLEDSARSEDEFREVTDWWDRLDKNRERKERYHEIGRDAVPLEWGASANTIVIPNPIQHVFWKQILKGEFLDAIFDCPFEMHELVTDKDISNAILELKAEHKEILYYLSIRQYSCQRIACIREQSDRNIRKVRDTLLKKLRKNYQASLEERIKEGLALNQQEQNFLHNGMKKVVPKNL